jgi:hypothetical protein
VLSRRRPERFRRREGRRPWGYVSNGRILSHEGDCWIGEEAAALGTVTVSGNARLEGWAAIWDDVELSGNARVYGLASLWGNTRVFENGQVSGKAKVRAGNIRGTAHLTGDATLTYGVTVSRGTYTEGNILHQNPGLFTPPPCP